MNESTTSNSKVTCPSCSKKISYSILNDHLDKCLAEGDKKEDQDELQDQHSSSNQSSNSRATSSNPTPAHRGNPIQQLDSSLGLKRTSNDSSSGAASTSSQPNKKQKQDPSSSSQSISHSQVTTSVSRSKTTTSSTPSTSNRPTFGTQTTSKARLQAAAPLAERLRPASLEEFIGQDEVTNGPLKGMLSKGLIPSCILWGPPGTGKTTLARLLTKTASKSISQSNSQTPAMKFIELSATTATTTEIKKVFDEAVNRISLNGQKTVLFLDEIQRFNRAQQDIFLPALEKGHIILIGATTENPSFRLQGALLSRTRVFILRKLSTESCFEILRNARKKALEIEIGVGGGQVEISDEILKWISTMCDGDARSALSTFELALVTLQDSTLSAEQQLSELKSALKRTSLNYDRTGDMHYDTISALHKSIRGSDADASIYWLARMISSGDDPLYIARRLIIAASEDVGTPEALQIATNTYYATSIIGLPEAAEPLAQAVLYLAEAKKSTRAWSALKKATRLVEEEFNYPVPIHIRNAPTRLMKDIGYGKEYRYEPSFAHPVYQPFLPPELKGTRFVSPPPEIQVEGLKGKGKEQNFDHESEAFKEVFNEEEEVEIKRKALGLSTANGIGPASCQRIFKIGARAVDLELLEEWERERNGGQRWEGREGLMEAIRKKEEEEAGKK